MPRSNRTFDRIDRANASRVAVREAEAAGVVADSLDVRIALVRRMQSGELTLEQGQAELRRIKRGAKKAGKVTRSQAYRGKQPVPVAPPRTRETIAAERDNHPVNCFETCCMGTAKDEASE